MAPYPTWDKSHTPAIPPKLTLKTSARFTRHHACPMDNGWVPVGIYLAKPFNSDELVARIYAITRRKGDYVGTRISYGDLTLDCETHALSCGEQTVKLGTKEFQILEMLLKNPQRVFPKELIIEKIWGYDSEAEYNNVEVYMSFTRKKLAFVGTKTVIKAVRGIGYELRCEDV